MNKTNSRSYEHYIFKVNINVYLQIHKILHLFWKHNVLQLSDVHILACVKSLLELTIKICLCLDSIYSTSIAKCPTVRANASYNSKNMKSRICYNIVVVCEYLPNNTANQHNVFQPFYRMTV